MIELKDLVDTLQIDVAPRCATREMLTKREREVLCLLATGHTDRKIAELLTISPRTVNRHMSNIFDKLEIPNRTAAAAHAVRKGFI